MRIPDVDLRIARLSADQHGMFTLPQAIKSGINLKSLNARFAYGLLERYDENVVRHPATPLDRHAPARAAWVAAGDERLTRDRSDPVDAVVTSFTAATILGLGPADAGPLELLVSAPTHSLPKGLPVRVDSIACTDWSQGPGFLLARPARAIADMLAHGTGHALCTATAAVQQSLARGDLDTGRLVDLLHPVAHRHGHTDGRGLFDAIRPT